jgi:predicted CXXCH cytochrome family protein
VKRGRILVLAGILLLGGFAAEDRAASIRGTPHDLSITGGGSVTERQICIFCHTPHAAISGRVPLWNHQLSEAFYTLYGGGDPTGLNPDQPDGATALCLSCHDGTVAVNALNRKSFGSSGPPVMAAGRDLDPFGRLVGSANLTTDLSDDHPVSFVYDSALAAQEGNLRDPQTLNAEVRLDASRKMQCSTCHNPHDNSKGAFLVMNNQGAEAGRLCLECHVFPGWGAAAGGGESPHNDPFSMPRSCLECHEVHGHPSPSIVNYPSPSLLNVPARNLTLPLTSGYDRKHFTLCYGCHEKLFLPMGKEIDVIGLPPRYADWGRQIARGLSPSPIQVGAIRTKFVNTSTRGFNQQNVPANIHWDHLSTMGSLRLVYDSDHDGVFDSNITCTACHDPHGTPYKAMTKKDLAITDGRDQYGTYSYIGSDLYKQPGGDVYCDACHTQGEATKYYHPK